MANSRGSVLCTSTLEFERKGLPCLVGKRPFLQNSMFVALDLMVRHTIYQATDARDEVYALLGRVSDALELPNELLPNFNK